MHKLCRLLKEKILDPALRIASPRVHEICTLDNYVLNNSFAHEIEIKLLVTFIASPVILKHYYKVEKPKRISRMQNHNFD
jgi:hypothetical protein